MTDTKDGTAPEPARTETAPKKPLPPAAERALAEAAARRAARAHTHTESQQPQEIAGRGGLDPARYGDWEVKGVASDF